MLKDGKIAFEGPPTSCGARRTVFARSCRRSLHAANTFDCLGGAQARDRGIVAIVLLAMIILRSAGKGLPWQRYALKTRFTAGQRAQDGRRGSLERERSREGHGR
jgi:hypothetical protein